MQPEKNFYLKLRKEEMELMDKLSPQALALYYHLRKRMNNKRGDFMANPSRDTLAIELGYKSSSVKMVDKFVRELKKVGLLRVVRTRNKEKRVWNSNQYYFKVLEDLNKSIGTVDHIEKEAIGTVDPVGWVTVDHQNNKEMNKENLSKTSRKKKEESDNHPSKSLDNLVLDYESRIQSMKEASYV